MKVLYRAMFRSMVARYFGYAVQLASLMLMSRWFTPEAFGVVASVQVFYFFFQMLSDGGLSPGVIGLKELTPPLRDGIFGLSLLIGAALGLVFYAAAPIFSAFYRNPEITAVVPYLAVGLFFYAAAALPTALLLRQQFFYAIAFAGACGEVIAVGAVYIARHFGFQVEAIALRLAIIPCFNFLYIYVASARTEFGLPMPGPRFGAISIIWKVTKFQLGFNILNYFSRNLDNVLVGKFLGASALGIYDKSYALMRYPLQLLTFAVTPAIQPILKNHASDANFVFKVHCELAGRLAWLGSLASIIIVIFADRIVLIAFGGQWYEAVPVIRVLGLVIPVQVILSTSGAIFQTFLRTDLLFRCGIFSAVTNVTAILIGVSIGTLTALAWCIFFSFHLNFVQAYFVMHKTVFKSGLRKFLFSCAPMLIAVPILSIYAFRGL